MKVKTIKIENFKRFHDLEIVDIPKSVKLVVLTGPNGSGKSGIFEAFNYWKRIKSGYGAVEDPDYFPRSKNKSIQVAVDFHGVVPNQASGRKTFYQRNAYRHDADFKRTSIKKQTALLDLQPPHNLNSVETKVGANYDRITSMSLEGLFKRENAERPAKELAEEYIGVLRTSMQEVFDDLVLDSPGNPIEDGTFMFTKGTTSGFLYKNLSGGEKATFDLLVDFIASREAYTDSVYCIDEPELHVGSRVQARLLKVLVSLLPENCQLWIGTHSIGMMSQARKMHSKEPSEVCFLDTSDLNFDTEVAMGPVEPDRRFWKKVLSVTLDDMADLVVPESVYVCEGDPEGKGAAQDFDAKVYRKIFGDAYPQIEFISAGSSGNLKTVALALSTAAPGIETHMVRDRDGMTDGQVEDSKNEGYLVLGERDIENYLLSDEVVRIGTQRYIPDDLQAADQLVNEKNKLLGNSDDVKKIAGQLFEKLKSIWNLKQPGLNRHAFMRDICAPLITPETDTYKALAKDLKLNK